MDMGTIDRCGRVLRESDAVLIGAGAGLTGAAGISYTDQEKFAEIFPAWVNRGFTMQYQLMGYRRWSQAEQWGYYTVHLGYVYYGQGSNPLYRELRGLIGERDYFVMTSNVDELFHKSGFAPERIYTPQGSYGKIQCTVPCSDEVWDMRPFYDRMRGALDPALQVLTDPASIPACPNCGAEMFIHARADSSFIDTVHDEERERLSQWLEHLDGKRVVLLELGAGYNTPGVIRFPMERLAVSLKGATFIRVNAEFAETPRAIDHRAIPVTGDIGRFIERLQVETGA